FQARREIPAAWHAAPAPARRGGGAGRRSLPRAGIFWKPTSGPSPIVAGNDKPGLAGVSNRGSLRRPALPAGRSIGNELDPDPKRARRAWCVERLVDLGAGRRQGAAGDIAMPQGAQVGGAAVEYAAEVRGE